MRRAAPVTFLATASLGVAVVVANSLPFTEGFSPPGGASEASGAASSPPSGAGRTAGKVTVALAGDVHGEPPIRAVLETGGNPLGAMARSLRRADLTVLNVETAVGSGGTAQDKQFTFRAPPSLWRALARSGVDVVSLANNHALDYGPGALSETISGARRAGIRVVGAGRTAREAYRAVVVRRRGHRVAVVGLSRVLPSTTWAAGPRRAGLASAYDEDSAVRAVRAAARRADRVVVAVHWGEELSRCPNSDQKRLARKLVAAGADVVAGHHPHVLQGVKRSGRAIVAYSLGNFLFSAGDPATRASGVLTAELGPRGAGVRRFDPASIDAGGRPRPVYGVERRRRLAELDALTPGRAGC